MLFGNRPFGGVVLDVDGVLWIAGAPSDGAITFLTDLRANGVPFCLLTNDCSVSKIERQESLARSGLVLKASELVTAPEATGEWLRDAAVHTVMYLGAPAVLPDIINGLYIRESGPVDAVVVGDLFAHYDRHSLDRAATAVSDGATLVAMQRNARWSDGARWYIDNGFWIAGLEYVTGKKAVVTGKPSQHAYLAAVSRLEIGTEEHSRIAFVSDDMETDLRGAKAVGLTTIYFGSLETLETLPPWVDHAARNMTILASLLGSRS